MTTTPTYETFNVAYALTVNSSGQYDITSSTPFSSGVLPAAGQVQVEDPNGGTIIFGQSIDVTSEGLNLFDQSAFPVGSNYAFVSQASVADGATPLNGVVIENTSNGDLFFLTNDVFQGTATGANGLLTFGSIQDTICFMAGTGIRTPDGDVPVETLKHGRFDIGDLQFGPLVDCAGLLHGGRQPAQAEKAGQSRAGALHK